MKLKRSEFAFAMVFVLGSLASVYGFDVSVHDRITGAAVNGSSGLANYLQDNNINSQTPFYEGLNVELSIRLGSINEDDNGQDAGGARSLNHFYDPTTKQGLSVGSATYGLPSETWGTISNAVNPIFLLGGTNEYSWQNARAYQSNSIVTSGPLQNRSSQAGLMFRSLGQVMHLLEDAAQPQHARNEQHWDGSGMFNTPWLSGFEEWGKQNINEITFAPGDFSWVAAGFTSVSNFWDTGLYNPNITGTTPLSQNETGAITLGLAEYCNGNFLTVRGIYGDLWGKLGYNAPVSIGVSKDYYPITQSTDLAQVESNPAGYATSTALLNAYPPQTVYRCYIDKTSQGAVVSPHSSMDLISVLLPISSYGEIQYVHADDSDVMASYYAILIPKAITYSAGLLDYFFRGRLQIQSSGISGNTVQFTVQNTSQQTLSGGVFRVFCDDSAGNRSESTDLTTSYASSGSSLAPNATITGSFSMPAGWSGTATLAFFGTIGVNGSGQPLDSVDSKIGCASVQFSPVCANGMWAQGESGPNIRAIQANIFIVPDTNAPPPFPDFDNIINYLNSFDLSTVPWGSMAVANFTNNSQTPESFSIVSGTPNPPWCIVDPGFSVRADFQLPYSTTFMFLDVDEYIWDGVPSDECPWPGSYSQGNDVVNGCIGQSCSDGTILSFKLPMPKAPPCGGYNFLATEEFPIGLTDGIHTWGPNQQWGDWYNDITDFAHKWLAWSGKSDGYDDPTVRYLWNVTSGNVGAGVYGTPGNDPP